MKKRCAFFLAVMLIFSGAACALAEDANLLGSAAVLTDDVIYYAGSVDGKTEGVYKMGVDGADATLIYEAPDSICAYQAGNILLYNFEGDQFVVIDASGKELTKIPAPYSPGIGANGYFYIGNLEINATSGASRTVFPIDDEEAFWKIEPICVDGDYLYYLDLRQMGDSAIEYDNCASLWRISLKDASVDQLMDTGVNYIGMDDRYVYLERLNFWYYDDEAQEEMETAFETGLFRVTKDGEEAKKLCETGSLSDEVYVEYKVLKHGVIYGFKRDYTDGEQVVQAIVAISTQGEIHEDIVVDEDTLSVVLDDGYVLSKLVFVDTEDYQQKDEIVLLSALDGSRKTLNEQDDAFLYYSEAEPLIVKHGDAVYYLAYDNKSSSEGFYRAALDGSGSKLLASGLIYDEDESEE